jgi:hypothetical protein
MSAELHAELFALRLQAVERLLELMGQVRIDHLSAAEVIAIVSAFEAAYVRLNADVARRVVPLFRRDGDRMQP